MNELMHRKGYKFNQKWVYNLMIEEGLTDNEAGYMVNKVSNAIRQCGDKWCCDNFRFSIDGKQDWEYEDRRSAGCCGFYDDKIYLKSGKVVKFGFNYGH